jgi:hypothetical protein
MTAPLASRRPEATNPSEVSAQRRCAARRFDDALAVARRRRSTAREGPRGAAGSDASARSPAPQTRQQGFRVGNRRELGGSEAVVTAALAPEVAFRRAEGAAPVAELRAAVRALPPVIEAAHLRESAQLTLALGGALGVDLRASAQGLEVTLRPADWLARAAGAELPGLVAALRARGLRVARAEVRPTPRRRNPAGAR